MKHHAHDPAFEALAYASEGKPVFPCREGGDKAKAPYLPGESAPDARDGGHWLASAAEATIKGWWKRWPRALIGLPTGLRSCTVVVDLDPKEAEPEAMLAALAGWAGGLEWADAVAGEVFQPGLSRTRSGGFHVWFRYPGTSALATVASEAAARGVAFKGAIENRNGLFRRLIKAGEASPMLANIDVRAEGGYVIAPPSMMDDGRCYSWIIRPQVFAPLPPRLLALITRLIEPAAPAVSAPKPLRRVTSSADSRAVRYAETAIANIAAELARAGKGQRGTAAFSAASSAGRFVVLRLVPESTVIAALEAACISNGLVADDGIKSVQREIANGLSAASSHTHLGELAARLEGLGAR